MKTSKPPEWEGCMSETRYYTDDMQLPCSDQTVETIHEWASGLNVGDAVALRQTYRYTDYEYRLGEVEEFTDGGRRVMVKGVGTFWRTPNAAGKNCYHPKGQLSMIEPTKPVAEAAKSRAMIHFGTDLSKI